MPRCPGSPHPRGRSRFDIGSSRNITGVGVAGGFLSSRFSALASSISVVTASFLLKCRHFEMDHAGSVGSCVVDLFARDVPLPAPRTSARSGRTRFPLSSATLMGFGALRSIPHSRVVMFVNLTHSIKSRTRFSITAPHMPLTARSTSMIFTSAGRDLALLPKETNDNQPSILRPRLLGI